MPIASLTNSFLKKAANIIIGDLHALKAKTTEDEQNVTKWLAEELNLDEETIKKAISFIESRNDNTIDIGKHAQEFTTDANKILNDEYKIRLYEKIMYAAAFTPAVAAYVTATLLGKGADYAAMVICFFSGPLSIAWTTCMDSICHRQNENRETYNNKINETRTLFLEAAEAYEQKYGQNTECNVTPQLKEPVKIAEIPIKSL